MAKGEEFAESLAVFAAWSWDGIISLSRNHGQPNMDEDRSKGPEPKHTSNPIENQMLITFTTVTSMSWLPKFIVTSEQVTY